MKPLTLYIAVGEQGSVTANIITYSRNLIREGAVIDVVIENLSRVLEGQRPIHVVDRNLGY